MLLLSSPPEARVDIAQWTLLHTDHGLPPHGRQGCLCPQASRHDLVHREFLGSVAIGGGRGVCTSLPRPTLTTLFCSLAQLSST